MKELYLFKIRDSLNDDWMFNYFRKTVIDNESNGYFVRIVILDYE